MKKSKLEKVFLVLAIFGLVITSYLTYAHYHVELETTKNFCSVGGALNFLEQLNKNTCLRVLQSDYSQMFGIPTALFGLIFYLFVIGLFILKNKNKILKNILFVLLVIGFLESVYFTYLQFFIIDGFGVYYFSSAIISMLLLFLGINFKFYKKA